MLQVSVISFYEKRNLRTFFVLHSTGIDIKFLSSFLLILYTISFCNLQSTKTNADADAF